MPRNIISWSWQRPLWLLSHLAKSIIAQVFKFVKHLLIKNFVSADGSTSVQDFVSGAPLEGTGGVIPARRRIRSSVTFLLCIILTFPLLKSRKTPRVGTPQPKRKRAAATPEDRTAVHERQQARTKQEDKPSNGRNDAPPHNRAERSEGRRQGRTRTNRSARGGQTKTAGELFQFFLGRELSLLYLIDCYIIPSKTNL